MYEAITKFFQILLTPLDRACNYLFGSRYNPLYQSGTIAITLLAIMIVTGLLLVPFYRLAFPFESMVAIDNGVYFSRWLRSLHRYASDAAVAAIVIHVWRMIAEGKTWGPRILAWTSGVILFLAMLIIGWSGFVMVWDFQGQRLASAGARMLDTIPLFRGAILHTFSGAAFIGQSFFFMNLFLHMSLPLAMIFGLWLHTLRLKRTAWFPARRYLIAMVGSLTVLSWLWPAPLAGPPDLLSLGGDYPLNAFYGFLIPLVNQTSPAKTFAGALALTALFLSLPFWLRPRKAAEPQKSSHNQAACTGCSQCYQDCPFEAIAMVPRVLGKGSKSVAAVIDDYCVGCGICSASCSQMAIGPADMKPKEQLRAIRDLAGGQESSRLLLIHCGGQESGRLFVDRARTATPDLATYETPCSGVLHPGTLIFALRYFRGVFVFGCEPRACKNRSGQELLELRVHGARSPVEPADIDHARIRTAHGSRAEFDDVLEELATFQRSLTSAGSDAGTTNGSPSRRPQYLRYLRSAAAAALSFAVLASLSAIDYSDRAAHAALRVAVRIPIQVRETCHAFSAEELAKTPAHMRKAQECTREPVPYVAEISVDDQVVLDTAVAISGVRHDKPMMIENEFQIAPGVHRVHMRLAPANATATDSPIFETEFTAPFEANRVELVSYNANKRCLELFSGHRASNSR